MARLLVFCLVSSDIAVRTTLWIFQLQTCSLSCFMMTDDSDGNDALMISWWWRGLALDLSASCSGGYDHDGGGVLQLKLLMRWPQPYEDDDNVDRYSGSKCLKTIYKAAKKEIKERETSTMRLMLMTMFYTPFWWCWWCVSVSVVQSKKFKYHVPYFLLRKKCLFRRFFSFFLFFWK